MAAGSFRIPLFQKYDPTSTSPTFTYGIFGPDLNAPKPAKTTGSSTTVVAVTAGDGAFDPVEVGSEMSVNRDGTVDCVYVATKVDADNITVDSAVNWQTGFSGASGRHYHFRKFFSGTTAADGWFDTRNVEACKIQLIVTTLTGTSITFQVEGRVKGSQTTNTVIASKTFTVAGSDFIDVTRMLDANWDEVRLGVQIAGDTGISSVSCYALGVAD